MGDAQGNSQDKQKEHVSEKAKMLFRNASDLQCLFHGSIWNQPAVQCGALGVTCSCMTVGPDVACRIPQTVAVHQTGKVP